MRGGMTLAERRGAAATSALAIALGVIFLAELIAAPSSVMSIGASELSRMGGNAPILTRDHREVWRLISAVYLHGGLLHVLFNVYALYIIGTVVELTLGAGWMMSCFVLSGVTGGIVSVIGNRENVVSIGASGGIFGLIAMAAALTWLTPNETRFPREQLIQWILFGLVLGVVGGFDNWGHIGGILGGVLMALGVASLKANPKMRANVGRVAGVLAVVVSVAAIVIAGVTFRRERLDDAARLGASVVRGSNG